MLRQEQLLNFNPALAARYYFVYVSCKARVPCTVTWTGHQPISPPLYLYKPLSQTSRSSEQYTLHYTLPPSPNCLHSLYEYNHRFEVAYSLQDSLLLTNLLLDTTVVTSITFQSSSLVTLTAQLLQRTLAKVVLALLIPRVWQKNVALSVTQAICSNQRLVECHRDPH